MQRTLFASALLVLGVFSSSANAVQDLPGYDLYRGAGYSSSFYSEGYPGYGGSYGAGVYVTGSAAFSGGCCGAQVTGGPCNPWAGYSLPSHCGFRHGCGHRGGGASAGCNSGSCCQPTGCCSGVPGWSNVGGGCGMKKFHGFGRKHRGCGAGDCCETSSGCSTCDGGQSTGSEMIDGETINDAPAPPAEPTPATTPTPAVTET